MPKRKAKKMKLLIERIADDDVDGLNIVKMKGDDAYRLRMDDYRAIYTVDMVIMHVEAVGHRQGIYE